MTNSERAIFAGGCFWCMVHPFDQHPGVIKISSGYTGGHKANPTYKEVCSGETGHTEAVEIIFDPSVISYNDLLQIYWGSMDPTDAQGQFGDRGSSYRPEIFYTTDQQKQLAEESKKALNEANVYGKPVVVPISPAQAFYPAEDYHQDFYKKEPDHYQNFYRASGRKAFVEAQKEKDFFR